MSLNLVFFTCKTGHFTGVLRKQTKLFTKSYMESYAVITHKRKDNLGVSLRKWYNKYGL